VSSPIKDTKSNHVARGFTEVYKRGAGWLKSRNPSSGDFAVTHRTGNNGFHFGTSDFTEANEVDTAWVDGHPVDDAPWLKKMVLADYNAYFAPGNDAFDSGQIIKYIHPESGEDVAFQPLPLNWTNDLDQIDQIAIPQQVSPTIDDDTLLFTGAYGTGLDFEWESQPARLSKKLIVNSLAELGSPPQYIIDGGNPRLALRLIFQKSSGVDIYIDGVLWDENTETDTINHVEFRLGTETLWYFTHPWGKDSSQQQADITTRYSVQASNLFVEIFVSWSWIETAVFPATIDPTVDLDVDAGADDGYNRTGNFGFSATDNYGLIGYNTSADYLHCHSFFRWTGVTIAGSILTSYIRIYDSDTYGQNQNDRKVYGIDEDNPPAPTTQAQFEADPLTSEAIDWDGDWTVDQYNQSPSLNAIFQELVDTYTVSADAVMVQVKNDGGAVLGYCYPDYYEAAANPAELYIEYSVNYDVSESDGVTVGENVQINTEEQALGIAIVESDPAQWKTGVKIVG